MICDKVAGAIGRRFIISINEEGLYSVFDKENNQMMEQKSVDQEKVKAALFGGTKESQEILKYL